jgi:hypothetical protein
MPAAPEPPTSSRVLPFLAGCTAVLLLQWVSAPEVLGLGVDGGLLSALIRVTPSSSDSTPWPLDVRTTSGGRPAPATCAEGADGPPPSPTPTASPPFLLQRHQAEFVWAALHHPDAAVCPIPRTEEGGGDRASDPRQGRRRRLAGTTSPASSFVSCESWSLRFAVGLGRSPTMDYLPTSFPGLHSLPRGLAGAACPIQPPGTLSEAAWARILSRLTLTAASVEEEDGTTRRTFRQPYKVLLLGGSAAAGVFCENELVSWKDCAWSARAVSWMRAAFPCADISLYNYAAGGTTISSGMASLHTWLQNPPDSDLLLVDFIVNDAFYDQVPLNRPFGVVPTSFSAAYEQFILQTRAARPDLEIVFVNTCALPRCIGLASEIAMLAAHYGIPVISYAAVVDAASITAEVCLKDVSPQWWGPPSLTHPRWQPAHGRDGPGLRRAEVGELLCGGDTGPRPRLPFAHAAAGRNSKCRV